MPSKSLLSRAAALLLCAAAQACFSPTTEADCLKDGTCECKQRKDCDAGLDCIDGRCVTLAFDAGTGEVGDPCLLSEDCQSGLCLPKGPGNGLVCTVSCDGGSGCTNGWQCKPTDEGRDVCVPPFQALCQPCVTANDCNIHGDLCLGVGALAFCGLDCKYTSCPDGYSCSTTPRADGGMAKQCTPDVSSCECSPATVGLTRSCNNDGGISLCFGVETCLGDGTWSVCDAKPASREVCDGLDNDCDGLVDQLDPTLDVSALPSYPGCRNGDGGTCVGLWTCGQRDGGFNFFCSGKPVEAEACNALDDNCNGRSDETYLDGLGRYADVHHCNACGRDCETTLSNLADAGVDGGQAACEVRSGTLSCVPKKCAQGYFPSPASAPQICQKAATSQCRSCGADSDCQTPGDKCIGVGTDPGTFCAQSCEVTAAHAGCTGVVGQQGCCPADNTCSNVGGQKLCLPTGNSCLCSPARAGFRRSCLRDAGTAVCVGTETCTNSGAFAGCDTATTAFELCDGTDNDCNGAVDEPFINTRGGGTYDTDQQCGSCTQNCIAQWSPTIQHAVGGCVVDAGVSCQIVQCTQESIPGGGACRLDSECGAGRTCHPTYRQCVQSCASAATCGTNGACVKGLCTRTCGSASDCTGTFGAPSSCLNGICEVPYQFNNADKDSTNGCECPSAQGVTDEPDSYATYPTAGMPYVDRDCDGIDGTAATSLFVWSQSPSSLGTRSAPFRTIGEALATFNPGVHSAILVAAGIYVERVVLTSGVKLHGGYSSDFSRRDIVTFPTLLEGPEPDLATAQRRGTVNAEGINVRTVISGFTVRGYDVTFRPALGGSARNSYAIYVKDSGPQLLIRNNHLIGGRGGDGANGLPGTAGSNGGVGGDGLSARECLSTSCANESQGGGAAGVNNGCNGANGNAGAASSGNQAPTQGYFSTANGNGMGGGNALYRWSDPMTQSTLCKYDCSFTSGNINGGAAQNGADGTAASGGFGCVSAGGSLVGDDWQAGAGAPGVTGTGGRPGGGGGAGGIVTNDNPATCTVGNRVGDLGGTGGGGGAAGCSGAGGGAARGGGASFGLFIVYVTALTPSAPTAEGNLIEVGAGGRGGTGGTGGYGGLGGQGGEGGAQTSVAWCAGQGGHGGRGGNGGAGSGGGGGCGGSAFGIAGNFAPAANLAAKNLVTAPPSTAAGTGGGGGSSPSGGAANGRTGSDGVAQSVRSF